MSGRSRAKQGQRVFVALDPPISLRAEVEAWARHVARSTTGLRVVPARNLHVTLAFLGDRSGSEIDLITEAVRECATDTGGLSLGAPLWLPRRRPRSLTLEIHDDRGELSDQQATLARRLREELGWDEGRPYRPHLTAARTSRSFEAGGLRLPVSPSFGFEAESVSLYRSHLGPDGAEYEALVKVPLGPGAGW
ncbi:MAG: RNA 2',3'-cyclic phosphodiesterase [Solirubrobacterales bacterium]|nr:RNA 2',3'-cyclic phosphodiesterase [Solirubrobacterales bacterium]HMT05614.1 RNA 2',3'-cyclic phosphodiesterase [Solirubrobacterales bacterium]